MLDHPAPLPPTVAAAPICPEPRATPVRDAAEWAVILTVGMVAGAAGFCF